LANYGKNQQSIESDPIDSIFSGLAWSFIFGIFASTLFSLLVIPVVYFLINNET